MFFKSRFSEKYENLFMMEKINKKLVADLYVTLTMSLIFTGSSSAFAARYNDVGPTI